MKSKSGFIIILLIILAIAAWISSSIASTAEVEEEGNVAVIDVSGTIAVGKSSSFFESSTSSSDIVELIEKADNNPEIKAILIEINSGGGSAVASSEIADALKNSKKLKVAVIREVGASGAYWVASACDIIVADEMSFVGSVGVYGSYLEYSGLMEKYGVSYRRLVAGEYKDLGTPYKTMTSKEEAVIQKQMDLMHWYFLNKVAENRNLTEEQKAKISDASLYLGLEAKDLNLIDNFGGEKEAVGLIEQRLQIKADLAQYRMKRSFIDLIGELMSQQSFSVGKGIGSSIFNSQGTIRLQT